MARLREQARSLIERTCQYCSRSQVGATAVEYALLVALIAAVILGVVALVGSKLIPLYQSAVWP